MFEPCEQRHRRQKVCEKIIGLGEKSVHASYYPELQRRLAEVSESERLLRCSLDALPASIVILDPRGQPLVVNQAWRAFAEGAGGRSAEPADFLDIFDQAMGAETAALFAAGIRAVLREESEVFALKYASRGSGEKRWFLGRVTAFGDQGLRRVIVVHEDITEAKRLEDQLRQAQKMEAVGRLTGGIAHHFNNMLTVILGNAELAVYEIDPAHPLYTCLREIQKAAQRSADLTRQLLAFARKQAVSPEILDLNETVVGMLNVLQRLIGEDIALVWRPAPGLWPVNIDPGQIGQLLASLCANARDAIDGVGKITIETENTCFDEAYCAAHADFVPGQYVGLTVSDSGCGMSPETLAHVFEPFFTTKEVGKGIGLGLAAVYGIAGQNGGSVSVHSQPGQGTAFRIYLPRYSAAQAEPRRC